jgi:hypothetical protein
MRDTLTPPTAPPRLELNKTVFDAVERLAVFEVGDALLMLNLELQSAFGLRVEEYQVHQLIALSTVRRHVRAAGPERTDLGRDPLPVAQAGSISRRRISEVLGIPLETVRRIVARLMEMGMVVERKRGALSTPGGTLQFMHDRASTEQITRRFITTVNALIRAGVVTVNLRDPG